MEAAFVKLWLIESVLMLIRFIHERRRQKRDKIGGYRISMKMNEAVIHVGLKNIRSEKKKEAKRYTCRTQRERWEWGELGGKR